MALWWLIHLVARLECAELESVVLRARLSGTFSGICLANGGHNSAQFSMRSSITWWSVRWPNATWDTHTHAQHRNRSGDGTTSSAVERDRTGGSVGYGCIIERHLAMNELPKHQPK